MKPRQYLTGKAAIWSAVLLLLLSHFFVRFYVPQSSDSREQQLPELTQGPQLIRYDEAAVLAQIELLSAVELPAQQDSAAADSQNIPDRFDSWHSDGQSIALMAIYQQHHKATALLWLKTTSEAPPQLLRLEQGGQHEGVSVTALTSNTATLQLNQQQRTLRLFTPGERTHKHNNQDSEN